MNLIIMMLLSFSADADIESKIPHMMEQAGIPGLSMAVIENGVISNVMTFGVKNSDTAEKVKASTVFQAASLSKPVFAMLCMKLVDEGLLDLDKPLATYLENKRMSHDARYQKMTARHVLSHRTGLPNWGGDKLKMNFTPGQNFGYSGEGYVYLGMVLEKITGEPINKLLNEKVLSPLKMDRSSYVYRPEYAQWGAQPHDQAGALNSPRKPDQANTAASLHTTATEYANFMLAALKGKGLSPKSQKLWFTPQGKARAFGAEEPAPKQFQWSLGWGILTSNNSRRAWHWGDNGYYKAFIMMDLDSQSGFVYFANSSEGLSIARELADHYLKGGGEVFDLIEYESYDAPGRKERREGERLFKQGNYKKAAAAYARSLKQHQDESLMRRRENVLHIAEAVTKPIKLDIDKIRHYVGNYGERHLTEKDGALFYHRGDNKPARLVVLSQTLFALPNLDFFKLEVITDKQGNPTKLVGHYAAGHTDNSPKTEPTN